MEVKLNKNKKWTIIAVGAAVVLALAGLFVPIIGDISAWDYYMPMSFTDVASDRAALFDGIQSYQGVDEFKASFAGTPYELTEKAEGQPMQVAGRPPHRIDTVTIQGYAYDGFTGKLEAIFFNNRLMSTVFHPSEPSEFIKQLSFKQGLKFDSTGSVLVPPYTLVRRGNDYKGRGYVMWTDNRLKKESDIWVLKY
jgi:hypothetical protein